MTNKLNCSDFEENLYAFVEQELNEQEALRIHEHLENCPTCQKSLNAYKMVITLARDHSKPKMTGAVRTRLHQALNQKLGLNLPVLNICA